jgi:hypothetical protein
MNCFEQVAMFLELGERFIVSACRLQPAYEAKPMCIDVYRRLKLLSKHCPGLPQKCPASKQHNFKLNRYLLAG